MCFVSGIRTSLAVAFVELLLIRKRACLIKGGLYWWSVFYEVDGGEGGIALFLLFDVSLCFTNLCVCLFSYSFVCFLLFMN